MKIKQEVIAFKQQHEWQHFQSIYANILGRYLLLLKLHTIICKNDYSLLSLMETESYFIYKKKKTPYAHKIHLRPLLEKHKPLALHMADYIYRSLN